MFDRKYILPADHHFFLFGPRGTGKSSLLRQRLGGALWFDLLDADQLVRLSASPERLATAIPENYSGWVVIDEVQKAPALLDTVHRLIETRRALRFALTGSSARQLRRGQANLLAGRAYTTRLHPLTAQEVGEKFELGKALQHGMLPLAWTDRKPERFLRGYVSTYLKEEVQQEGLIRNLGGFARFLEATTFSQAAVINVSEIARECGIDRSTALGYFQILEDLLLAERVPPFTRRAKRAVLTAHPKFFLFDCGVFRALRPSGPLDRIEEIDGAALETLVYQELRAANDYGELGYSLYYWRTRLGQEVDFVLYGPRGFWAIEVKRSARLRGSDFSGLDLFLKDYPEAKGMILYAGSREESRGRISILPIADELPNLAQRIAA